jgi:hypothetical protein
MFSAGPAESETITPKRKVIMHSSSHRRFMAVIVMTFLPVIAFGQGGLYWESTTKIQVAGDHSLDTKSYYLPRMFRQGSEEEAVVFRLDRQVMYSIDYADSEYSEITFAELEAYVKKATDALGEQLADLKKQLEGLPAEQRKMMEEMMGGQAMGGKDTVKVEVRKTAETKTISGFACTKYLLMKDTVEAATVWTTAGVAGFNAMQKDFKEFSRRLASQMSINGPQMAAAMEQVDGFPVVTSISGMTSTVLKVEAKAIAAGLFEVPAGFRRIPFEKMQEGRNDEYGMPEDEDGDEGAEDDEDDDGGGR